MSQPVQLRGQAHVLPAPADGQRQLLVGHHHLDALCLLVEHDLGDFRRRQCVDHEGRDVRGPLDDVDLLALQFVHDRLDAAAAHADAGADRIDRAILGAHRDLGAAARIAGNGNDLDDAIVDFRHFLAEEARHELGMGARQEDLRTTLLAPHVVDIGADPVTGA